MTKFVPGEETWAAGVIQRLVGGLCVRGLRGSLRPRRRCGTAARSGPRATLPGARAVDGRLGGAEGRRPGLHVDVGEETTRKITGPAGPLISWARRDPPRNGASAELPVRVPRGIRSHRGTSPPHQAGTGVKHHGLVGGAVLELRVEHPVVPAAAGRVAVDERETDRGGPLDRRAAGPRLPARPCRRTGSRVIRDGVGRRFSPETTLPM